MHKVVAIIAVGALALLVGGVVYSDYTKVKTSTPTASSTSEPTTLSNVVVLGLGSAIENSQGLVTLTNGPLAGSTVNEYTTTSGVESSTNSSVTDQPNVVLGSENVPSGTGSANYTVYSYGSVYQGPGEYVSTTGAPEYISSQAEWNQQKSAGFL